MGYREKLTVDFKMLGIQAGDTVLMHTSLKGLNTPGLAAEEVIESLLTVLGEEGTLLVPALSYQSVTRDNPIFRVDDTPSCIGVLPEVFRKKYAKYRSIHPTHSVCAVGRLAYALTAWHKLDNTPVGPHSPFMQLPVIGGKILMLGCGLRYNTFMHGVEEYTHAEYPLADKMLQYTIMDEAGKIYDKAYYPHNFGRLEQRYDRLADVLGAPDLVEGNVLGGKAHLIDTAAALKAASGKMYEEPEYFIDRKY
jgi:aminoglycoside 3-N-acetyltransferase